MSYLKNIEDFFTGQFNTFKMLATLIKLEARLARLTLFPLIINICMIFIVLITLWISFMVLAGYSIFYFTQISWISILSVCLINLLVLLGLFKYLSFNLNAMSFAKTRQYLLKQEKQGL